MPGMSVVRYNPIRVSKVLVVDVKHVVHKLYLPSHMLDHQRRQHLHVTEMVVLSLLGLDCCE